MLSWTDSVKLDATSLEVLAEHGVYLKSHFEMVRIQICRIYLYSVWLKYTFKTDSQWKGIVHSTQIKYTPLVPWPIIKCLEILTQVNNQLYTNWSAPHSARPPGKSIWSQFTVPSYGRIVCHLRWDRWLAAITVQQMSAGIYLLRALFSVAVRLISVCCIAERIEIKWQR